MAAWPLDRARRRRRGGPRARASEFRRRVERARDRGLARPHSRARARRLRRAAAQRERPDARAELERVDPVAARLSVPRSPVGLREQLRRHSDLVRRQHDHAAARRDPYTAFRLEHRAHDLDGRPPASARLRRAHVDGVLDRGVGRQQPQGHDHAPEGRLAASQRRRAERQRDRDGVLRPSRRSPDLERLRPGPAVPRGAVLP